MANYITSEPMDIIFVGDGTSTTLTYDLTQGPFFLDFYDNYAGLYVEYLKTSNPPGTAFSGASAGGSEIELTFNQGFNTLEARVRHLWQSL
jgi:hypothetical protein